VASSVPVPWPVRWILLALPPLLAAALYWQSQHYDHGLVDLTAGAPASGAAGASLLPSSLAGRERVGKVRKFSRDTLYEYVNGHAEYYLSAGFESLSVAEYGADGQGQPSLVVNLWDMGRPLHAFGVLMDEAGPDAVALEGETLGFLTGNGLSAALGRYYLQLSRFDPALDLAASLDAVRSALGPVQDAGPAVAEFPAFGRLVATRFVKEAYRGIDLLSNVIERRFERDGAEIEAFLIQGDAAKIADLERGLLAFLDADAIGHEDVAVGGRTVHRVSDRYEGDWFFFAAEDRLVGAYAPLDPGLQDAVRAYLERGVEP